MSLLSRRRALAGTFAAGAAALVGTLVARRAAAETPREIEVVARRFQFTPNEIPLKLGERVVLAVRSLDFIHGFHVPDLGIRADLVPGRVTRIELQPQAAGTLDFLCDNFCGDGHEEMQGRFLVSE
ncbi:MAG TPA: cupredoxin domain-containing protein [Rhizobacter sp.]|nr:cupredoxin domain-containing protein [Rhizobacter sp.]